MQIMCLQVLSLDEHFQLPGKWNDKSESDEGHDDLDKVEAECNEWAYIGKPVHERVVHSFIYPDPVFNIDGHLYIWCGLTFNIFKMKVLSSVLEIKSSLLGSFLSIYSNLLFKYKVQLHGS